MSATSTLDPVNDRLDVWSYVESQAARPPMCETSPFSLVSKVIQGGSQGITVTPNSSTGKITVNGPGNGEGVAIDNINNINLSFPSLTNVSTLSNSDLICAYATAAGHHRSISYSALASQMLTGYVTLTQLQQILAGYATSNALSQDLANYVTLSRYGQLNNSGPNFTGTNPGWYFFNYGGFFMQWGVGSVFGSGFVSFPITFPNSLLGMSFSGVGNPGSQNFGGIYTANNSGFTLNSSAGPLGGYYLAFGF